MTCTLRLPDMASSRLASSGLITSGSFCGSEVVHLGGEIVPPQRDAEQKPHPRHDPVAIADAQPALDQVQLEAADVVSCRRVGRALQERGQAPAAVDVASLRMAPQLAGSHILDHTLAQRADGGISAHGELLLSEVANTSSSSGRGSPPRYNRPLNSLPIPPSDTPAQRLSRQRFSALAHRAGLRHARARPLSEIDRANTEAAATDANDPERQFSHRAELQLR